MTFLGYPSSKGKAGLSPMSQSHPFQWYPYKGTPRRPGEAVLLAKWRNQKQLPGPSVGTPEQVITALEDRKFIVLIPHVDSQGEVKGRGDDSALVLEMKSYMRLEMWAPKVGSETWAGWVPHSPPTWTWWASGGPGRLLAAGHVW